MKSTQWKQVVRKKDCMVPRKLDGYHIIFMRKVLVRECGKVEQERPLGEAVDETKRKERLKSGLTQGLENDESKRFSNNSGVESPKQGWTIIQTGRKGKRVSKASEKMQLERELRPFSQNVWGFAEAEAMQTSTVSGQGLQARTGCRVMKRINSSGSRERGLARKARTRLARSCWVHMSLRESEVQAQKQNDEQTG